MAATGPAPGDTFRGWNGKRAVVQWGLHVISPQLIHPGGRKRVLSDAERARRALEYTAKYRAGLVALKQCRCGRKVTKGRACDDCRTKLNQQARRRYRKAAATNLTRVQLLTLHVMALAQAPLRPSDIAKRRWAKSGRWRCWPAVATIGKVLKTLAKRQLVTTVAKARTDAGWLESQTWQLTERGRTIWWRECGQWRISVAAESAGQTRPGIPSVAAAGSAKAAGTATPNG